MSLNIMTNLDFRKAHELRYSGECSDLTVAVGQKRFSLHSFPMMCHSEYFAALVRSGMLDSRKVDLTDLPGGERTMDLLADYCYHIPILNKLTVNNICHVICAAHYLQMNTFFATFWPTLEEWAKESVSNCCNILAQSADVMHIADETRITFTASGRCKPLCYQITPEIVSQWVVEMSSLPINWIHRILEDVAKDPPQCWQDMPIELTDQFLNVLVSQGSLSGAQFLLLLTSTESLSASRTSFDSTFEALEKALARTEYDENRFSDEDIAKIVPKIDFTRVSQDVLERAGENKRIPQKVVLNAALTICSSLRTAQRTAPSETTALLKDQQPDLGCLTFRKKSQTVQVLTS
ncbi:uncharacterized protein LOC134178056 [Corticium candelabrum]|uniref:uncharacterized protein LOC134178056 n=1 Tax=Corticium candelabrum TaxID=121492 RepID=UPI002E270FAC|nr:uncharacterized protein LOC134178056 [Corticium candelabrum]